MAHYTIVSMPGDGIGKTVLPESVRVLERVGFDADYVHGDIGWDFWCSEGNALPDRTVKLIEQHKLGLFGAITSKPKWDADAELDPQLKGKGLVYYSPIVTMRQKFALDLCVRPCRSFPGNPLNFVRKGLTGGFEEPEVDVVIFRQGTEGSYAGVEWTNPPQNVRDAFATHPASRDSPRRRARTWPSPRASSPATPPGASSARPSSTPRSSATRASPWPRSPTSCARPRA